ncbi:PRC-barrel domain-containing protein [Roseicyclus sp. F158]|uniref:PRC-barrel domain-containing protein n=1 Tax=Tropicimonas omnivorans TaxID=3075590 RepID=A0ABU3DIJ8_9RHOB|nr:PRC-barrel domain-containing protein [Roseicyclus sp. F158]MDT0683543.1 PRC-barrel domain-containing protein [Roseicyclus sp. F158]
MKLMIASALALTVAAPAAFAQDAAEPMADDTMAAETTAVTAGDMDYANLIRTRDITGGDIYSLNDGMGDNEWTSDTMYDGVGDNWNDIGEIEDVVLDTSGQMVGIVAEIGGFLDIGDKHVFIPVDNVRLVPVDDAEYAYVTQYSEEQLEELEGVDEGWWN